MASEDSEPREMGLLGKFIKAEHFLGKSRDDIVGDFQAVVRWFITNDLLVDANHVERLAIEKLGFRLTDLAVARRVDKILAE